MTQYKKKIKKLRKLTNRILRHKMLRRIFGKKGHIALGLKHTLRIAKLGLGTVPGSPKLDC